MFKGHYQDNIEDMLQACEDIEKIVKNITFNEFEYDMMKFRATERLFEILGEAGNRIPKEIQEKYPEIPWKNIIGMRNIIIHTYERVDVSTLWGAAKKDLPSLKPFLKDILADLEYEDKK